MGINKKSLTPLQRRLAAAEARKARGTTNAQLKVSGTAQPSKEVPTRKVTRSAEGNPPTDAKTLAKFVKDVALVDANEIRDEMKKDPHVLVVNAAQFASLAKDHAAELKRVASKAEEGPLKTALLNIGKMNTYRLAVVLMKRFIDILEKHLDNSGSFTWTKQQRGNVALYFLSPARPGVSNVFNELRDSVFSPLREELVYNSAPGTVERSLSVIIAGLDVDYDEITKGLGAQAKQVLLQNAPEGKKGAGVQLGHFRGGATVAGYRLVERLRKAQSKIVGLTGFWFEAKGMADAIHEADAEVRFNDVVYNIARQEFKGAVNISIIGLEQTARNQISGAKTRQRLKNLKGWLIKNAAAILTVKGSRPIVNMVLDDMILAFLGHEAKTRKIVRSAKTKVQTKVKTPKVQGNIKTTRQPRNLEKLIAEESSDYSPEDLHAIIELINERLHDKIQQNMGKGGSKQLLNYRTGRFAKSAKVEQLFEIKEKNALGASVKYMRHPYGVFEPGGRLHKAGRDPHSIFGRSIRQILQEQKLANLRRVKVTLRG